MKRRLSVLANINVGNDLAQINRDERVSLVCEVNRIDELLLLTEKFLGQIETESGLSARCTALLKHKFGVEKTVKQIVGALSTTEIGRP